MFNTWKIPTLPGWTKLEASYLEAVQSIGMRYDLYSTGDTKLIPDEMVV